MVEFRKCAACGSPVEIDPDDPARAFPCEKCGAFVSPKSSVWNPYAPPSSSLGKAVADGLPLAVPQSIFGKFGLAIFLLGQNFVLFSLITLTVGLPAIIAVEVFAINAQPGQEFATLRLNQMLQGIFGPISIGALVYAVARRMDGERVGYLEAIGVGFGNWGRLFVANFFAGLYILLGCIALIVPGIVLSVRYSLLAPVVVLERPTNPRRRSSDLTVGRAWSIVGAGILFYAFYGLAFYAIVSIVGVVQEEVAWLNSIWVNVATDCVFDVLDTVFTITIVLYYLEGRQRESAKDPLPDDEFAFGPKMSEIL